MLKKIMPERIPALGAVFYNFLPAKMFVPHYKMIAQEVALGANGVLLDIGTGPGILPLEIAKRFSGSKIIGIDLSEKMIEISNKNNVKYGGLANVEFMLMDANALKFNDNSLDMIISTGSLHHWKNPIKILNEVYRCLKPGCQAWIYDGYGNATDADIHQCIQKLFFGFPSAGLVKRILRLHGFSQQEYETTVKAEVVESRFKTCLFEKRGIMMRLTLRKV
jgi:ubiquinone/menaquinone biosynthesis C-methylase UbiE